MEAKYKIGFFTAISLVIANMIGTGVFTSLGYQLINLHSVFTILILWFLGGIISFCGALVYAELGSAMPKSGGEYVYLSKLLHPSIGFLSGWISSTVGFAAPVALAAMALGAYINKIFDFVNPTYCALFVVAIITTIHSFHLKIGSIFQRMTTLVKIIVIVIFIIAGLLYSPEHEISVLPTKQSFTELFSGSFWVSLIYVSYAYSGWNAASYLAGDMKNPQKDLPKALLLGTCIVTIIYVLLNFIFLYSTPITELTGVVEIGHVSAMHIFGNHLGKLMSIMIALLLISSISAMIMAGPRIIKSMGDDLEALSFISKINKNNVPYVAIIMQSIITLVLILTNKFEQVLTFVGFSLSIFTFLTVCSVFVLRKKHPDLAIYKTWAYPITPIIFLALNAFILYNVFSEKTMESLYGLLNIVVGAIIYLVATFLASNTKSVA